MLLVPLVVMSVVAGLVAAFLSARQPALTRVNPPGSGSIRTSFRTAGGGAVIAGGVCALIIGAVSARFFATSGAGFGGTPVSGHVIPAWAATLCYFAAMILGMLAQTLFVAIRTRKSGTPPTIEWWGFVAALVVSPLVFGAIYKQLPDDGFVQFAALILSFQNGFFWQDVLSTISAKPGQG